MRKICNKKGQVWIETVIYTLIGLAIIGILLAASKPKIEELRDKLVIEQTIESLNNLDTKVYDSIRHGTGNRRIVDFKLSKGTLGIDSSNNVIYWLFDSRYQYSEEGVPINLGNLKLTTTRGNPWLVNLSLSYSADLVYEGEDNLKEFGESPTPYQLYIRNDGSGTGNIVIDIGER